MSISTVSANPAQRKMIYIMSPSYSGSTLLTLLLDEHPDIATIGELKASGFGDIETYLCSCGSRLLECDFWQQLKQDINSRGGDFDPGHWRSHFQASAKFHNKIIQATYRHRYFEYLRQFLLKSIDGLNQNFQIILKMNYDIVESVCRLRNKPVFLDGSKDPIRLRYFIDAGFWDIRVIYLVRDGRATSHSYQKHMQSSYGRAAKVWRLKIEEMNRIAAEIPTAKLIKIRYEDLCRQPQATLAAINQFADLTPFHYSLKSDTQNRHILGNNMRLKTLDEIRLDEKWRTTLKSPELAEFHSEAGVLNQQCGY